jgi:hypothetical protein
MHGAAGGAVGSAPLSQEQTAAAAANAAAVAAAAVLQRGGAEPSAEAMERVSACMRANILHYQHTCASCLCVGCGVFARYRTTVGSSAVQFEICFVVP